MYFKKGIEKFLKKNKQKKNLILSGGNSIKKSYKLIEKAKINWNNINIYLIDERDTKKINLRNIAFLKKIFKKKKIFSFDKKLTLKKNKKTLIDNLKYLYTLTIIGVGEDGHFASIFYNLKKFKSIIDSSKKPNFYLTEKIGKPFCKRYTMNLSMVLLSNYIIIVLKNKKRLKLFTNFIKNKKKKTPIYYLIKKAKKKIMINYNKDLMSLNFFKKTYA
tara:strand:+ start:9843 stop:10496 length:654 start_codon:yes stop_codon:yes gene_type:complete